MKMPNSPSFEGLRQKVRDAVRAGDDLRQKVHQEICAALQNADLNPDGLRQMAGEVMAGAREGFDRMAPADRGHQFRDVVDGLADALASSANACRLAIEEARGHGQRFKREELQQAAANLEVAREFLRDNLAATARAAGDGIQASASDLAGHASRAWERSRPSLEAALAAARAEPVALGKQGLQAGSAAATEAAGALLVAVGRRLQALGEHCRGDTKS